MSAQDIENNRIPLESCYCIVCMTCFYCQQPWPKLTNATCLCTQKLLDTLPELTPEDPTVMKQNTYLRAFILDWVKRNAYPDMYDTTIGFHIQQGQLLTIPLCEVHHTSFNKSWAEHLDFLDAHHVDINHITQDHFDHGFIIPPSEPPLQYCYIKFVNWHLGDTIQPLPRISHLACAYSRYTIPNAYDDTRLHQLGRFFVDPINLTQPLDFDYIFMDADTGDTYRKYNDCLRTAVLKTNKLYKTFIVGKITMHKNTNIRL